MLGWLKNLLGGKKADPFLGLLEGAERAPTEAEAAGLRELTPERARYFQARLDELDPERLRRLARLLDAAGGKRYWKGPLAWLEPFVTQALNLDRRAVPYAARGRLSAEVVERCLDNPGDLYWYYLTATEDQLREHLARLGGLEERLAARADLIREGLQQSGAAPRHVLQVLIRHQLAVEPFLPQLVKLLGSSHKTVRTEALRLLGPQAVPYLREALPKMSPSERLEALPLLPREDAEAWESEETDAKVRTALTARLQPEPELPTVETPELDAPLHSAVAEAIRLCSPAAKMSKVLQELEKGRFGKQKSLQLPYADFAPLLDMPELTLPQAVRLGMHCSHNFEHPHSLCLALTRYRKAHSPPPGLREFDGVLHALQARPGLLEERLLSPWDSGELLRWGPEAIWPLLAGRGPQLREALADPHRRPRVLEVLKSFPSPPPEVLEELWTQALTASRPAPAQAVLARTEGFQERVLQSLQEGRQEARAGAAQWLARLRLPESEGPLRAALKKEKQEGPRAAMMLALESLGLPLDEFLDWDAQRAQAGGTLPDWLPSLPEGGLEPSIVSRWVAQAIRLKAPEANPLLRLYCQGQEALGAYLLEAWIKADSPVADKGILSVVASCGGTEMVRLTERFLKQWYGIKASQSKALVAMLASSEEPLALQLVLGVANRFRTKGIQQEAERQAQLLAERKGWTVAELADRTIPTGGLDPDGRLELDYGPRVIVARVLPDFNLEFSDETGKVYAGLPEARQSDEVHLAAQAKKAVANCKKEVRAVARLQRDRLYEAMCTQRGWTAEDWRLYLWEHPLLRFYCQRLVWLSGGTTFRPLADGTLVDHLERDFTPVAEVTLAHQALVTPEVAEAWERLFQEYRLEPVFPQFGRTVFALPEEAGEEIVDFRGHMLTAFGLRNRATALGWSRGPAEDGGWFMTYEKRFPDQEMDAVLGFTGNGLPEQDRQVALTELSFSRGGRLPLAEVPPILLSECYHDLATIAAEGPGFDPAWRKKSV